MTLYDMLHALAWAGPSVFLLGVGYGHAPRTPPHSQERHR